MKNLLKETANQTINLAKDAGSKLTDAAAEALGVLGKMGGAIGARVSLHSRKSADPGKNRKLPGASPGIENIADLDVPPAEGLIAFQCLDYGPESTDSRDFKTVEQLLAHERPAGSAVRWINIAGLHPYVVNQMKGRFALHTLAAEDVLSAPQRPKLETYEDHLFIVIRMLTLEGQNLSNEQVSVFFFKDTIITIQERSGDVWDTVRKRIEKPGSRLRKFGAEYLLYALLDSMVDHLFPIMEGYGDLLEALEHDVMANPTPRIQRQIHSIKRDLIVLRRVMWPVREVVNQLYRDEEDVISPEIETYFRDVYDHAVQVIDIVETLREMAGGLNDLFMSSVGNRMNEIMKVLTIMASFFIPITFVAGVYGMNFDFIPELKWKYSYAVFWCVCLTVSSGLAIFFYRKGWIGGGKN